MPVKRVPPWTPEEERLALELDSRGAKQTAIAKRLNRSRTDVGTKLVALRGRKVVTGADVREGVLLYHPKGLTDGQIARRIGCTVPPVTACRRRLGLPSQREIARKKEESV